MGDGGDGQLPGPDHVGVEDPTPHFGVGRLEVAMGDDRGGAGIVDQDVESTVGGHHLLDETGGIGLVGDVGLHVSGVG